MAHAYGAQRCGVWELHPLLPGLSPPSPTGISGLLYLMSYAAQIHDFNRLVSNRGARSGRSCATRRASLET